MELTLSYVLLYIGNIEIDVFYKINLNKDILLKYLFIYLKSYHK